MSYVWTALVLCIIGLATSVIFQSNCQWVFTHTGMNKFQKCIYLAVMVLYIIFDMIQVINALGGVSDCRIWHICSMLAVYSARFVLSLQLINKAMIFVPPPVNRRGQPRALRRRQLRFTVYVLPLIIFCAILSSLLQQSTFVVDPGDICHNLLPSTRSSTVLTATINIYLFMLNAACAMYGICKLRWMTGMRFAHREFYPQQKLLRKFYVTNGAILLSVVFMFCISLFVVNGANYAVLLSLDGVLLICANALFYVRYDRYFSCLCKCVLPPAPLNVVNNLEQISTILHDKYEAKFVPVISEAILPHCIGSEDIVHIISSFLAPSTDLKQHLVYRPYWIPHVENVAINDVKSIHAWKASKIGGIPYLLPTETWPTCAHCNQHLPLMLQIDMNALPDGFLKNWVNCSNSDLYRDCVLQYFQCSSSDSAFLRVIRTDDGNGEDANRWSQCLAEYRHNVRVQSSSGQPSVIDDVGHNPSMEIVIGEWTQKLGYANHNLINFAHVYDDNDEEKHGLFDFKKYEYELPSVKEYRIFHGGIFEGFETELKDNKYDLQCLQDGFVKHPYGGDKLGGYYCRFATSNVDDSSMLCAICGNHLQHMIFQFKGQQLGIHYRDGRIAAVFICEHHRFHPQLVLLPS